MALNYVVSPGAIMKEYMEERNISQKDLARIVDSSERHISNLINAKIKLTEEFALKLEKVFTDIQAEFWMDLETNFRLYLLRTRDFAAGDLKKISEIYQFKHIFKGMNLTLTEQAGKMLEILGVSSFEQVDSQLNKLSFSFMEDGGDGKAMYLWLKLCESEIDIQNNKEELGHFNIDNLRSELSTFKDLMYTQNFEVAIDNIKRLANGLGIVFVYHESIPNAKIRGAVRVVNGRPHIYCSNRYKRLDTFYFAFVHELGHLLSMSSMDSNYEIVTEDEELLANTFARNFFINNLDYMHFVETHKSISSEDILVFSKKNRVVPDVLIGFLEHDRIIQYGVFNHLKGKI